MRLHLFAIILCAASIVTASADQVHWQNAGTDFNYDPSWDGAIAGSVGAFNTAPGTQPQLTDSISVVGLFFDGVSGYNLTSSDSSYSISLTASGTMPAGETMESDSVAIAGTNTSGTNTIGANISLASAVLGPNTYDSTFYQAAGGSLMITGTISDGPAGSAGLILRGDGNGGTFQLAGDNTYTGNTTIAGNATVIVSALGNNSSGNLGRGSINFGDQSTGGTLVYAGTGELTDKEIILTGTTGGGTVDQSGTGALVFGNNLISNTAGAKTVTLQGSTSGSGEITGSVIEYAGTISVLKRGSGTWIFSGPASYTGTTNISAGTLLFNGSTSIYSPTGTITVNNSGSVLGGNGGVSGAVTLGAGAILRGGTGATTGDSLTLNSTVDTSAGVIQIALGGSGAHSSLVTTNGTWTFGANQAFSFIDLGAEPGMYANIITGLSSDPGTEAGWIITNGWTGSFTYDNGNLDFNLTAVPEPSTWAAAVLAATFVGQQIALRRRRRAVICVIES